MLPTRTDALLAVSILSLSLFPIASLAQAVPAGNAAPGAQLVPVAPPSVWSAPAPTAAPTGAAAPVPGPNTALPEIPPVTQAFVGIVVGEKVYVRSGPDAKYYEMGQLDKGDLVYIVASSKGWYQILPPSGTFCLIARELVDVDAAGNATVKADFVNVRAGTALYKDRDPSAVLAILRKGAKLSLLGPPNDKYYTIAPPEKAYVYISPQFIKAAPGTEYKAPQLKLSQGPAPATPVSVTPPAPGGGAGGAGARAAAGGGGAAVAAGGAPGPTIEAIPGTPGGAGANPIGTGQTQSPQNINPVPVPTPAVTFDPNAATRFTELNTRFEAELKKPLLQQDLDGLLKDYKSLLATENLPPSVKIGTESQVASVERFSTLQRLANESAASNTSVAQQRQALQEQFAAAERAVAEYQKSGPFLAEGTLQNSSVVAGKFALVNPATGRVVAYVNPVADIDIASLVGKYIGVRGIANKSDELTVIQVKNATLLPAPSVPRVTNAVGGRQ